MDICYIHNRQINTSVLREEPYCKKMIAKVTIVLLALNAAESARILGFFVATSISHQVVYQPIWKELALRGHQVTAISPNILGEDIPNLKEIDVSHAYEVFLRQDISKAFNKENSILTTLDYVLSMMEEVVESEFQHPEVMEIINGNNTDFDIILVEALFPLVYAWAGKFNVPVVGISSMGVMLGGHDAVGNPTHPVISPDVILNIEGESKFWDRLKSVFYNFYYRYIYHNYWIPRYDRIVKKYFGENNPYLGDLEKNVSLLLLNVNPLMHTIRPNVPAVVEISQMHIKPKRPLPADIKKFLDESTEGVVYFSLGSNVKSANLDPSVRQIIIDALGELPYKVLWKWETDYLPGKPNNVKVNKWLPPQDVLGHPNIKAFVTQGGIQSIEESLSNGVPMVGIPFIADQPLNVMKLVEMGAGEYVNFATMTKDDLKQAILNVAGTPSYKAKALELKTLLTDQPMVGVEKAVWWIEYVLRHKGAKHLISPVRDMPYWKYFCLDVFGFLLLVVGISIYLIFKVLKVLLINKPKTKYKAS